MAKGQQQKVCKLLRSIYGLKQASRSWNLCFDETIKTYGFEQNVDEPCVYKYIKEKKVVFLVLYIDDILLIRNDVETLSNVKKCSSRAILNERFRRSKLYSWDPNYKRS